MPRRYRRCAHEHEVLVERPVRGCPAIFTNLANDQRAVRPEVAVFDKDRMQSH